MGVGPRVQSHKSKLQKETNDDTFGRLQNPGTPKCHSSRTSHFYVTKRCGQKVSNQGGVDYEKQTETVNNSYKKNLGNRNSKVMESIVVV